MNVQRTNITLPSTVLKQLQLQIPQGKRSMFIAEAITEKLGKKKSREEALKESLKVNYKFDKKIMEDWAVTEVEGWPE
ncbi:MAG: hypothetical protein ACR2LN_05020 [Candidatus Levyibacteriota bacterium]